MFECKAKKEIEIKHSKEAAELTQSWHITRQQSNVPWPKTNSSNK